MTTNAKFRATKIQNAPRKHKESANPVVAPFWRLWPVLAAVFFGTWGGTYAGEPIPVAVGWQVPLREGTDFRLQIARDSGFAHVLHEANVSEQSYEWQAPEEGVYHWRLLRDRTDGGAKRNTFVSGSFAAISSTDTREGPPRLSWEAQEAADRYKLYVLEETGDKRTMMTDATEFLVPRADKAQMIEVVPYEGGRRLKRHYHYMPSLKLETPGPEKPAAASKTAVASKQEKPSAPVTAERQASSSPSHPQAPLRRPPRRFEDLSIPQPRIEPPKQPKLGPRKGKPVPERPAPDETQKTKPQKPKPRKKKPETTASSRIVGSVHTVRLYVPYGEETLRFQKLEIDGRSRQRVPAYGGGFFAATGSGVTAFGHGTYHEHEADVKAGSRDQVLTIDQSRFTADLSLGWDLLAPVSDTGHKLVLAPSGAAAQLPRLPLEFRGAPDTLPGLTKERLFLWGGSLAYAFSHPSWQVIVSGGFMAREREEKRLRYGRIFVDIPIHGPVALTVGGLARVSELTACHDDAAVCLREGEVRTQSRELSGILGLGGYFF